MELLSGFTLLMQQWNVKNMILSWQNIHSDSFSPLILVLFFVLHNEGYERSPLQLGGCLITNDSHALKWYMYSTDEVEMIFQSIAEIFSLAVAWFRFVFQISSVAVGKEHKLRQAMTMMGLYDSAWPVVMAYLGGNLSALSIPCHISLWSIPVSVFLLQQLCELCFSRSFCSNSLWWQACFSFSSSRPIASVFNTSIPFLRSVPQVEPKKPDDKDEDVFEEENTVKRQVREGTGFVNLTVAIQIRGLTKTFPRKSRKLHLLR
ncbi:hypothetical protein RHMOL_Rhmol05G0006300 [Rhododendron molle]|uniref:Uncharacterized protein n=1 Tax=Rhododendron molle TaxID=49168 RepID=A0ACC0NJ03_RHOML|nr:hypothetical protein RHMOL_Rhmol05G0006300 [Rhododendron molle]